MFYDHEGQVREKILEPLPGKAVGLALFHFASAQLLNHENPDRWSAMLTAAVDGVTRFSRHVAGPAVGDRIGSVLEPVKFYSPTVDTAIMGLTVIGSVVYFGHSALKEARNLIEKHKVK